MKCPACYNKLSETTVAAVTIDICPLCKGIWFDTDELLRVVGQIESKAPGSVPSAVRLQAPVAAKNSGEKEKICPRCDLVLSKYNYAYDSNIILDRCGKCRGIWADGGELSLIAGFLKKIQKL